MKNHFKPPIATLPPLLPHPLPCSCCISTICFMERGHLEGTFSLPAPNLPSHYLPAHPVLFSSYVPSPNSDSSSGTSTWCRTLRRDGYSGVE